MVLLSAFAALSCTAQTVQGVSVDPPTQEEKVAYWYSGKAEIASYALDQSRYGAARPGEAVLIFVTEDFSKAHQVKLDNPQANPSDKVPILKMNQTRNFLTGIYPYSTMTSAFSAMTGDYDLQKISASIQEWCGHTYMQVNQDGAQLSIQHRSYFQSEGDKDYTVQNVTTEEELFLLTRIDPNRLPVGEFDVLPSLLSARLLHFDYQPRKASATATRSDDLWIYTLSYTGSPRELQITFHAAFPYWIESWRETDDRGGVSVATKQEVLHIDYWNRNSPGDEELREDLGLDKYSNHGRDHD